ncbi:beta-glucosidase-like glycosyl hydrolase [Lutibacter sp. Hel_I_33_5]|uniref:glycoside hydrolase family 3 N-terminal domain-containing protein n=1 Tax=Lutibacter sp. Hel_I_33_5 TaxID=1566289 RepID=UPI0011A452A3|nr:glycoside hydrolase family 3 N-terminal domain-containing protein [Lutibacter sp. Hel_I_33_5]TVZ55732.1 beta-glucosidase-like glycosyl hydrolase [Lutibacter sp. Hel_I_33_5]
MSRKLSLLYILFFVAIGFAQQIDPLRTKDFEAQEVWVDSLLTNMSVDEKIGQLFMVQAYSNLDKKHEDFINEMITKYHVGNLIFMQGTPQKQVALNNKYQALAKTPLLIGFDGEWGLDMRLKNTYRFPWNMTLGAIENNQLIEDFGTRLGKHCKRVGIHVNFAPVVDINTNPDNPIIGNRSFGESKENVTQKAIALIRGMQRQGVLANAKHFPGHGDTATDSHHTLPVINFDEERLDSIELYPYKRLFEAGVGSVMTAHLSIPKLEPDETLPSSLSKNVTTDLLQHKLGFQGLVITDGLNMKGAANYATSSEIDLAAILAGNDMLLIPQDVPGSVTLFKSALDSGQLTEERLDISVRKILKAKYWAGLYDYQPIKEENLNDDLNSIKDELLHRDLVKNSITFLKDVNSVLPIKELTDKKIAYVKLGDAKNSDFVSMLKNYTRIDIVSDKKLNRLIKKLKKYDLVIIGYHKSNAHPWKGFKFKERELVKLQEIARENKVILNIMASPYSLLQLKSLTNIDGLLVSYQNSKLAQEISAQAIFGAIDVKGKLPVSIGEDFSVGNGIERTSLKRLGYSIPEEVNMSSKHLKKIDSVAKIVVRKRMAPGAQILVARHGKVIYNKSFGYHTNHEKRKVKKSDVYDVASLTKILSTLPMVMHSIDEKKMSLFSSLGDMLPKLAKSNKDTLEVREVLSHVARLKAWIPFYKDTQDSITGENLVNLYSNKWSKKFRIKVAKNLYLHKSYKDSIFKFIKEADQRERKGYKYSDLGYYLIKEAIEKKHKKSLDKLSDKVLYKPLGANRTSYLPLKKFAKKAIVPTEKDDYYRDQLLQGYVHDMGAAMQGGVGGHAGLFANANDIAKIMQMYLQEGFYGGKEFFKSTTFSQFNKRYYADKKVRRGVGFDKPQLNPKVKATCGCVSDKSFGHSGFTGTYTWADPESGIVYVFLSNRVYPTMNNRGLVRSNARTEIQQIIQDAILPN